MGQSVSQPIENNTQRLASSQSLGKIKKLPQYLNYGSFAFI